MRMNRTWKAAVFPLLLGLCLGLCPPIAAEEITVEEKTIVFSVTEDGGLFTAEPDQPAIWEYPLIPAGQTRRAGTLQLRNDSNVTVHLQLKQIELPYNDYDALAYLDALHITVTEGEQTLYDGSYSRIADADGLKLEIRNWAPGDTRELSIALRCPFSYAGDPAEVSQEISWVFTAYGEQMGSNASDADQPPEEELDLTAIVVISGAGLLLLICIILSVVSYIRKR